MSLVQEKIKNKIRLSDSKIKGIQNDLFQGASLELIKKIASQIKVVGRVLDTLKQHFAFLINLGTNNGLFRKCNLLVYKEKVYGEGDNAIYKEEPIAVLIVTKLDGNYSEAKIFSGDGHRVTAGLKVRVIERQPKFVASIPSIFIPGLSQFIHGKYSIGMGYLISEVLFFGIGLPMVFGIYDFLLKPENRFDTVIEKDGDFYNAKGRITSSSGRVNAHLDRWIGLMGWSLFGVGVLVHVANIFDAVYPAWTNPVLAMTSEHSKPYFHVCSDEKENRYYLGWQMNLVSKSK